MDGILEPGGHNSNTLRALPLIGIVNLPQIILFKGGTILRSGGSIFQ